MQLLIVHDDAEVGEQLMCMVQDYASHNCALVDSDVAAYRWADAHEHCEFLLTQLDGQAVDGLVLGGSLSEIFPGLQTVFFPGYPASAQQLELEETKVFPEPIDGERLLKAIENAEELGPNAPDLFHVLDLLQMCCLSGRGGAVQIVRKTRTGIVYLRDGRIVNADCEAGQGTAALTEMMQWGQIEFAYDPSMQAATNTLSLSWSEALMQTARPKEEKWEEPETRLAKRIDDVATLPLKKRGFFAALRRS